MFTVTLNDESIFRLLMQKAAAHGGSVDEALREVLIQEPEANELPNEETEQIEGETPGQKLVRPIDEANLQFPHLFDARDAEDILRGDRFIAHDDSVDTVVREPLAQKDEPTEEEAPILKMLRLIHEAKPLFTNPFDGRDASDIMRREAGEITWRTTTDDVRTHDSE